MASEVVYISFHTRKATAHHSLADKSLQSVEALISDHETARRLDQLRDLANRLAHR
jgi:hypothetical protein